MNGTWIEVCAQHCRASTKVQLVAKGTGYISSCSSAKNSGAITSASAETEDYCLLKKFPAESGSVKVSHKDTCSNESLM